MNSMLNLIWTFFQTQIKNAMLDICQQIITLIGTGTSTFWTQSLVMDFLDFSKWANYVVFGVTLLFMLFDIGEEIASGKDVDLGIVFTNSVKAMVFVNFNSIIAITCMQLGDIITSSLNFKLPTDQNAMEKALSGIGISSANFIIVVALAILIACLVFFVMSVMRYGAMFVQILASSFYIPNILRGETQAMGDWMRQTVAIAGTYTFQYVTFYCGLYYLLQYNVIICAIFWAGMMSAGKVLQKFSYSTGTKGVFSSLGSAAGQGISLLSKV